MFEIKLTENIIPSRRDEADTSIVEAIQTIYPHQDTWIATMNWNGYAIALSGGTISFLYADLLRIIDLIRSGQEIFENNFLDSAFTARWEFKLRDNLVHIKVSWFDITTVANKNEPLKNIDSVADTLIMDKDKFIATLRLLIDKVNSDLLAAGYPKALFPVGSQENSMGGL